MWSAPRANDIPQQLGRGTLHRSEALRKPPQGSASTAVGFYISASGYLKAVKLVIVWLMFEMWPAPWAQDNAPQGRGRGAPTDPFRAARGFGLDRGHIRYFGIWVQVSCTDSRQASSSLPAVRFESRFQASMFFGAGSSSQNCSVSGRSVRAGSGFCLARDQIRYLGIWVLEGSPACFCLVRV